MERLDKIIASQGKYSRKDVKKLVHENKILINNSIAKSSDIKIDIETAEIIVNGEKLEFKKNIYLMLNKPKGYVSATKDKNDKTVIDLVPEEYKRKELFPAGRLDKDTTGLMIITDDGQMAHNILSPKKHVKKVYIVTLDIPVTKEMVLGFEKGVKLNDGECKTAKIEILDEFIAKVTLTEGRYHQIKRMFGCFSAKVIELHRVQMGNLKLPEDLKPGESRELTNKQLEELCVRD